MAVKCVHGLWLDEACERCASGKNFQPLGSGSTMVGDGASGINSDLINALKPVALGITSAVEEIRSAVREVQMGHAFYADLKRLEARLATLQLLADAIDGAVPVSTVDGVNLYVSDEAWETICRVLAAVRKAKS